MIVYKTLQSFPFFLIKFLDLFTYKIFLKVFTLKLLLKFTPIDENLQKKLFYTHKHDSILCQTTLKYCFYLIFYKKKCKIYI